MHNSFLLEGLHGGFVDAFALLTRLVVVALVVLLIAASSFAQWIAQWIAFALTEWPIALVLVAWWTDFALIAQFLGKGMA